jgi:hypothetical protein
MSDAGLQKTNVTLSMLIDSGIILPGAELVCPNPKVRGLLNPDGSIQVIIDGKEKTFQFLSGAARYIEKRSLNGWLYWSTMIDGERQNLGDFRDQFLKMHNS